MVACLSDFPSSHVPMFPCWFTQYEMYKEYSEELYKDRIRPAPPAELYGVGAGGHSGDVFRAFAPYDYRDAFGGGGGGSSIDGGSGDSNTSHKKHSKGKKDERKSGHATDGPHDDADLQAVAEAEAGAVPPGVQTVECQVDAQSGKLVLAKTDSVLSPGASATVGASAVVGGSEAALVGTEVCFLSRTAFLHDSAERVQSRNMFEEEHLEGHIQCKSESLMPLPFPSLILSCPMLTWPISCKLRDVDNIL